MRHINCLSQAPRFLETRTANSLIYLLGAISREIAPVMVRAGGGAYGRLTSQRPAAVSHVATSAPS